jgi:hypothetical protein
MGARAMQHLQSYGQPEPVYDNNAYTISSNFDGNLLQMYTTHPTAPTLPNKQPEYHRNQIRAWAMTSDPDTFQQGDTAYRNSRDWAKKKRDEFIKAANERGASLPQNMSVKSSGHSEPCTLTNRAATLESTTSTNELASDHKTMTPRSSKRLKRG